MDHLFTLNDTTPKLRCNGKSGVPPSLIFGLDSKLWLDPPTEADNAHADHHAAEVETATIHRGVSARPKAASCDSPACDHSAHAPASTLPLPLLTEESLAAALSVLPKESVYRVKGFVRLSGVMFILNWAFGRWDVVRVKDEHLSEKRVGSGDGPSVEADDDVLLTMMGEPGEVKRKWAPKLAERLTALAA